MRHVSLLIASFVMVGLTGACTCSKCVTPPDSHVAPSAKESLALLKEGNARFSENRARHPHSGPEWRRTVAQGQHPFAVVLGCSDSRVPVERVFDRGLGDLFVMRNAGNVVEPDVRASIDYATTHLHVPLVVVLGHEKCGAVAAALGPKGGRANEGVDLQALLALIDPALVKHHVEGTSAESVAAGVQANVRWSVARLEQDAANGVLPGAGKVMFVGAIYDLDTGRVRFLDSD